jgi:hypothetical protein
LFRLNDVVILNRRVMDPVTNFDGVRKYQVGTNGLPSTGIPYVLVNGTIMVKDSKVVDGKFPGQAILYAIEESGKFEPLEKESYREKLMAPEIPEDLVDHGVE